MVQGGSNRVIRGGNWNNSATNLRCANRNNNTPSNTNNNIGVRLCSTLDRPFRGLHGRRGRAGRCSGSLPARVPTIVRSAHTVAAMTRWWPYATGGIPRLIRIAQDRAGSPEN
ncbi:MAG: SUMF1/EgtB/PvdO family nonheme iron enzyme [Candidatus Delongbacteria bacterium]|nr:SUMF1/EgtB/PvdO family nonheme iron enzyme [Candidatus Delongbacteria bacterium]